MQKLVYNLNHMACSRTFLISLGRSVPVRAMPRQEKVHEYEPTYSYPCPVLPMANYTRLAGISTTE